jgi:hypothetical protein
VVDWFIRTRLRLAIISLLLGAGGIWWMSFSQTGAEIGPDSSLYLAFVNSVDPLVSNADRVQTSKLRARLVPQKEAIFIDIRIRADAGQMPAILVSNVVDHDCYIGANTTPYLSGPTRRDEHDFQISFEPVKRTTLTAKGETQKFLVAHVNKVNDVNKDSDREVRVICRSTLAPYSETFTDRKLAAWTMPNGIFSLGENLQNISRQRYSIDFSGFAERDGFRVFGGNPVVDDAEVDPATSRILPGKDWPGQATVVWRETKMTLLRDVALIVSGSMLGFSGAFFIEALRSTRENLPEVPAGN